MLFILGQPVYVVSKSKLGVRACKNAANRDDFQYIFIFIHHKW